MSSVSLTHGRFISNSWIHRWIYYLAAGFLFTATLVRSMLVFQDTHLLDLILLLLGAGLVLFVSASLLYPRFPKITPFLIAFQTILVLVLLFQTRTDYFVILFAILGMQAMQQFPPRLGWIFISLCAVLTILILIGIIGMFGALALAVAISAVSVFAGAFLLASRRAQSAWKENQSLSGKLQEANRQLQISVQQQERLAAARARQHLARELHDSITQTIFSMNLTTQSALLLLERDRPQVAAQLERLDQLAQSALAEMQVLISELAPEARAAGGFLAALQKHLADRLRLEALSVSLEVQGSQPLEVVEEAGLFRIAQEALNNIIKHAGTSQAVLRLHLADPFWMEIEDRGAGFDLQQVQDIRRVGLSSMRERAAGIGWNLRVDSAPGAGTCVRVEKGVKGT